jgi:hypothetical protein
MCVYRRRVFISSVVMIGYYQILIIITVERCGIRAVNRSFPESWNALKEGVMSEGKSYRFET